MKKPTLLEIKNTMLKLGMRVFTRDFDCTLGGIRDADPYSNTFNDFLFMLYHEKGELKGVVVEGTVDAGLTSRRDPSHVDGVAIIAHSFQYMGAYQLQDPERNPGHWGHKGRKAFRQIRPLLYWRDSNKDGKADFSGEPISGLFQTNGHTMGTLGREVNNWSEGCWGATIQNMNKLFEVAQKQIDNGLGDWFSFAMLHEFDIYPRFTTMK